jgi:pimeloyl-ACP methyl ester carboxylesterase
MDSETTAKSVQPALKIPLGRRVVLPGRGRTFVREVGTPSADLPTLVLVHGWMASAGLNWAPVYEPLAAAGFHVLGVDLRGHGRGIRSWRRFQLEECADDIAALVRQLGCGPIIVVGYSMGGLVSQLVWQRHRDLVAGLVLCSTTQKFELGRRERYLFISLMSYGAATVRVGRGATVWYRAARRVGAAYARQVRPRTVQRWVRAELRRHDMRQVLEAGYATCQFDSRPWLGAVDVPTALVVTTRDRAIHPDVQMRIARSIPTATVHTLDDDHMAFMHREFPPVLLEACREVTAKVGRAGVSSRRTTWTRN